MPNKLKVMIGINTLTTIEQMNYANHIAFFHRLKYDHPDIQFATNTPRRMPIDRMRNMTAKVALENNFDYVMFIDDDVIVPVNAFTKLLALDKDIAAAWTIIRGYPFENMFFRYEPESSGKKLAYVQDKDFTKGDVIDVDAVGFSCCLIKCSAIKKVPAPYFVTGSHNTEDIYFCIKARSYSPDTTIVVDTSIETAHLMGPEFIAPWNKDAYKRYTEEINPEVLIKEKEPYGDDRSEKYAEMVDSL